MRWCVNVGETRVGSYLPLFIRTSNVEMGNASVVCDVVHRFF